MFNRLGDTCKSAERPEMQGFLGFEEIMQI